MIFGRLTGTMIFRRQVFAKTRVPSTAAGERAYRFAHRPRRSDVNGIGRALDPFGRDNPRGDDGSRTPEDRRSAKTLASNFISIPKNFRNGEPGGE